MLTDEDIKRIGNEIVKRMTGVANIKKRRNKLKSEMYKPTVRYDFQDGIGDTYDLSDDTCKPISISMKRHPATSSR